MNYIKNFLPESSKHTSLLSKLLKKNPPSWQKEQTQEVKKLKEICQNPPPLKIPATGKRILQTDASDEFWGAVLIEQVNDLQFYCGYASGQFKEAEKHFHTVYKEILAVKYGIKKFEFHLVGYNFLVHMDNSSFPKIMDFKNKGIPEPQLLRLKDWFSKYQFEVKHIKGNSNLIPDLLTRPKPALISSQNTIPIIFMLNPPKKSPDPFYYPEQFLFPPAKSPLNTIHDCIFYAQRNVQRYVNNSPELVRIPLNIPNQFCDYLFNHLIVLPFDKPLTTSGIWYFWCLSCTYHFALQIHLASLLHFLSNDDNCTTLLWFLEWFLPKCKWYDIIQKEINLHQTDDINTIFILHRGLKTENNLPVFDTPFSMVWKSFCSPISHRHKNALLYYLINVANAKTPNIPYYARIDSTHRLLTEISFVKTQPNSPEKTQPTSPENLPSTSTQMDPMDIQFSQDPYDYSPPFEPIRTDKFGNISRFWKADK